MNGRRDRNRIIGLVFWSVLLCAIVMIMTGSTMFKTAERKIRQNREREGVDPEEVMGQVNEPALFERSMPLEDAEKIKISYATPKIIILPTEGDELLLSETYRTTKDKAIITEFTRNGDTIVIKNDSTGSKNSLLIGLLRWGDGYERENRLPKIVQIQVPESFAGNLEIDVAAGDIEAQDFSGRKMDIDAAAGDVYLENIQAEIQIDAAAGDIEIVKVNDSVEIDAAAGDIQIRQIKMPEFYFEADYLAGSLKTDFDQCLKMEKGEAKGAVTADGLSGQSGVVLDKTVSKSDLPVIRLNMAAGDIACSIRE